MKKCLLTLLFSFICFNAYAQELIPFFSENLLYGFTDNDGEEVIPPKYIKVNEFKENLSAINFEGLWGFIDKTGKEIFSPKYEAVESFSSEFTAVKMHGKWGFIDKTGKEIIPCKFDGTKNFFSGQN